MGNDAKTSDKLEESKGLSVTNGSDPLLIDEFDIIELEDRLELAGRCNGRCAPD